MRLTREYLLSPPSAWKGYTPHPDAAGLPHHPAETRQETHLSRWTSACPPVATVMGARLRSCSPKESETHTGCPTPRQVSQTPARPQMLSEQSGHTDEATGFWNFWLHGKHVLRHHILKSFLLLKSEFTKFERSCSFPILDVLEIISLQNILK